jgi:hypothetical protein
MSIFNWFSNLFESTDAHAKIGYIEPAQLEDAINPANALPMIGGMEGVDIEGNPYGSDAFHDQDPYSEIHNNWSSHSNFDDNCGSSFDHGLSSSNHSEW